MADHPHITPVELAKAAEVYQRTASYSEAARAIGKHRVATMRALKRASDGNTRAQVYARTLDAVLTEAASAQRLAVRLLKRDLRSADPKVAHSASAQINDAARAAATARTAVAKLTGEHAAEKHAVSVAAEVVVLPALEMPHGSPAPQGAVDPESGPAD